MTTLDNIKATVESLDSIPTVPAILQPLTELLRLPAERIDVQRVVELVSYDSAITAQCLRMANSPLFGRRNLENVRSAVVALGFKRVESMLLSCCLNRIMPAENWVFDRTCFWRHSLGCALISRKLAMLIGYEDPEKAYLAGLLHDLGILINNLACSDQYGKCLATARDQHLSLHVVEPQFLGFTHVESGRMLAQHWHFSEDVVEVIAFHHDPSSAPTAQQLVSLVHISDLLSRLRGLGYGYYEALGVDFTAEESWHTLMGYYPALASMDLARLTMDIDGALDEIVALVDTIFKPQEGSTA